jgi:ankyrin repeat protein
LVSNEALVRWFFEHGADPNVQGDHGEYTIPVASANSTPAVIDLLLLHGATLHDSDALHTAAKTGRVDMVKHLLNLGMDINMVEYTEYPKGRNWAQGTPLHSAISGNELGVVKYLLERDADPVVKNTHGESALDSAMKHNRTQIVEILKQHQELASKIGDGGVEKNPEVRKESL